jgi:hypothetical protein
MTPRVWMCARTVLPLVAIASRVTAVPVAAQFDRGQIVGFVKDETGAIVPGATVTGASTSTAAAATKT